MIHVTRRERFSAAHFMYNKELSGEENSVLFGKCSQIHGHNYELSVTVKGDIDRQTGYLIDLGDLSKIIQKTVLDILDHTNLNTDVPFLEGRLTSTEILAQELYNQLDTALAGHHAALHKVRLVETENNCAEYGG